MISELFTPEMLSLMALGFWESIYMTLLSAVCAYILGLPMGVVLTVTSPDGIRPQRAVYRILGGLINILRSVPFIILLVALVPFTRLLLGRAIGSTATVVPLVIAAAPFIARLVEGSLREVDRGVVEAAQSMGASNMQIVMRVLLPESVPALVSGAAISLGTILGYSAISGMIGGGGLGAIAINYGYYRRQSAVMLAMIILLVLIMQFFQFSGDRISRRLNKKIK